ncbi:hypothetical protein PF005_g12630 [Phytophthora fragariae]|uniref:Secreted protein n=1 Tax=Phytophthora fragariae TaxID=53985 RepID=A0A6A3U0K5_9STRA|nr:hypothetical protein PF003_g17343 [Phytophthora fragariae]KAE8936915.1 hypothetical protein PF009_g13169 [Phytophthora fragariae]KAE9006530.1 hypothetical protein PF011_g11539 [Phytophthora fragariae]KAE9110870.1 hypothetical protein PF007_g11694 [Phytophthora fragariae]KAE9124116.1 hypothetical protein PF010_g6137 [Phytophthora fragariae]
MYRYCITIQWLDIVLLTTVPFQCSQSACDLPVDGYILKKARAHPFDVWLGTTQSTS